MPMLSTWRAGWLLAALICCGLSSLVLAGCTQVQEAPGVSSLLKPEGPVPTGPTATPTPAVPGPDQVAAAYFAAWQEGRHDNLYDLLSSKSKTAITGDAFVGRYRRIRDGIGLQKITVQAERAAVGAPPTAASPRPAGSPTAGPPLQTAKVPYQATYTLTLLGEVRESNELVLVREPDAWRVDWNPGLLFKGLTESTSVRYTTDTPRRGSILDRAGQPLAEDGTILTVGVIPGKIKDEAAVLQALSDTLKIPPETIKQRYQNGQPDWFMPIVDRPAADQDALQQAFQGVAGIAIHGKTARVYPLGPAAAHLVGYTTPVTADELKQLAAQGYEESDRIGRAGVEAWGDKDLAGQKGAKLTIVDQGGQVVRTIAERPSQPGADLQLTIDADLQTQAAKILGDQAGSLIVMDPRVNGIRALASSPSYDPNQFILGLSDEDWQKLNGPAKPLLARPTEATYPTGSIFKIITMAAGLEKGGFHTTDTFNCAFEWHGLPGVTLHNWEPQGVLDLIESLSESCDPAFYTIGLKLNEIDPNLLPDYARAFGLGRPTGVEGLTESAGVVPDPAWKQQEIGQPWYPGDAVNFAIGQGYLLATPLQMANAYSSLAAGTALRTPLLVQAIQRPDGSKETFTAQEVGQLSISTATRSAILEGMKRAAGTPRGTAYYAFSNERTPTAAKTGSAENENPDAHAWFAGFQTPDQPTALTIVMIEGGQHGGTVAAPLGRQALDAAYPRGR